MLVSNVSVHGGWKHSTPIRRRMKMRKLFLLKFRFLGIVIAIGAAAEPDMSKKLAKGILAGIYGFVFLSLAIALVLAGRLIGGVVNFGMVGCAGVALFYGFVQAGKILDLG
jgi:hypothetical protein